MKKILITFALLVFSHTSFGAHHETDEELTLEKRQADAVLTITNVDLGDDVSTISAKGIMGEYGTVYVTYHFTYNADRTSGFMTSIGRGAIDADTVVAGASNGIWTREGSTIKIRQVVQISNGTQNLDVIDIDILKDTFVVKAYTLK